MMTETKRKGARLTKDIPVAILNQLNSGEIETANLVEWLAVDQRLLLVSLLRENNRLDYLKPIENRIDTLPKATVNTINEAIGTGLFLLSKSHQDEHLFGILAKHNSDLVRCWATYVIGKNEELNISETLQRIQPFASDHHFGVREISWMAIRSKISQNLEESIAILSDWTSHENENIRRFTTESTRPRGVWSEHIIELKNNPELALSILEPLKADPSKYVQDSVGNWLNDASKSQPEFVIKLCQKWESENAVKSTQYIIKKALRTINKQNLNP